MVLTQGQLESKQKIKAGEYINPSLLKDNYANLITMISKSEDINAAIKHMEKALENSKFSKEDISDLYLHVLKESKSLENVILPESVRQDNELWNKYAASLENMNAKLNYAMENFLSEVQKKEAVLSYLDSPKIHRSLPDEVAQLYEQMGKDEEVSTAIKNAFPFYKPILDEEISHEEKTELLKFVAEYANFYEMRCLTVNKERLSEIKENESHLKALAVCVEAINRNQMYGYSGAISFRLFEGDEITDKQADQMMTYLNACSRLDTVNVRMDGPGYDYTVETNLLKENVPDAYFSNAHFQERIVIEHPDAVRYMPITAERKEELALINKDVLGYASKHEKQEKETEFSKPLSERFSEAKDISESMNQNEKAMDVKVSLDKGI